MAANLGHVLGHAHALGRAVIDRPMLHAAAAAAAAPTTFPRAYSPLSPALPRRAALAADKAPFSIQTVGPDAPGPTTATESHDDLDDFVVVTMTEPVAAPTAAPEQGDAPPHDVSFDHERPPPSGSRPPTATADGECRLMGPFAIFVQLGLGALALLSLVFKRWRERPQRPVKVWFFDASKQVFGSVLVHMSNVFLSLLTSGRFSVEAAAAAATVARALGSRTSEDGSGGSGGHDDDSYAPNPCSFYLLNLAIDTTVGIPILIVLLRLTTAIVAHTPLGQPLESIRSGHYGQPPRAWWWLKQSMLYFCGLLGMKVCVLIIFLACPWISRVGDWALGWTEGNEQVQIVFVMMLFPLIMNGLQYYIIDSYIKRQDGEPDHSDYDALSESDREDPQHHSHHPHDDRGTDGDDESSGDLRDEDEELDDLDDLEEGFTGKQVSIKSPTVIPTTAGVNGLRPVEYDPAVDGDSNTVISSSASQRQGSTMGKV